jgi:CRISPR-associated protein Cas2
MARNYLVAYDIANDLRLRRIYKIVRDYGERMQWSVYLCRMTGAEKAELYRKLRKVLHGQEDQVLVLDLGRVHGQYERELPDHETLGRPLDLDGRRYLVV